MSRPPVLTTKKLIAFDPVVIAAIDEWRRAQADLPTQSEAIRRLIELGLKTGTKGRQ